MFGVTSQVPGTRCVTDAVQRDIEDRLAMHRAADVVHSRSVNVQFTTWAGIKFQLVKNSCRSLCVTDRRSDSVKDIGKSARNAVVVTNKPWSSNNNELTLKFHSVFN